MIIHVTSSYPPRLGGLEKVVQVLADTQQRMGQKVRVITANRSVGSNSPDDGFTVTRQRSFMLANTIIMPGLFYHLLQVGRDDVVHVHVVQAFTPEVVLMAAKLKRFKYVAQIHLDIPPSGPAGFLLKLYKPLVLKQVLHGASSVIVFTKSQKQEIQRRYGLDAGKVKVVPNGVEEKYYYNQSRKLHNKPRLLFVGRLNFQKNLKQLLRALDGVSDQFETNIVGDGEQEQELKKLTKELKLQYIYFAGRADGQKLINYYKQADIFVLPSEREGMPLVLLEAMAMALPIVATNVTGSRDVVRDSENGLLVPYNDADAFRAALLRISSDPKLYKKLSQTSRKMAEQYSWSKVAAQFKNIYKAAHEKA